MEIPNRLKVEYGEIRLQRVDDRPCAGTPEAQTHKYLRRWQRRVGVADGSAVVVLPREHYAELLKRLHALQVELRVLEEVCSVGLSS